jgi:hypothetical protein
LRLENQLAGQQLSRAGGLYSRETAAAGWPTISPQYIQFSKGGESCNKIRRPGNLADSCPAARRFAALFGPVGSEQFGRRA